MVFSHFLLACEDQGASLKKVCHFPCPLPLFELSEQMIVGGA